MFKQFFLSRPNPFLDALKLYANCSDVNSSKASSVPYTVFEELNRFKKFDCPNVKDLVDDNLKMVAFNFAKANGQQSMLKLVTDTFELVASNQLFVDKIKDLIAQHNYKDVSRQKCNTESSNWI